MNIRKAMIAISTSGYLIFFAAIVFRRFFSDFALGFCQSMASVFLCVWIIYLAYCFIKKKNPTKV